jgi:hypothetical protein
MAAVVFLAWTVTQLRPLPGYLLAHKEIAPASSVSDMERYRRIAFAADHPYWVELRRNLEEFQLVSGLDLRVKL